MTKDLNFFNTYRKLIRDSVYSMSDAVLDYKNLKGSYAGAMGLPQFMPDNYRKLAVDFDKNGSIDLWHSKMDIYASISNFLNNKGWQKGGSIYVDKKIKKENIKEIFKKGDVKTIAISNKKLEKSSLERVSKSRPV